MLELTLHIIKVLPWVILDMFHIYFSSSFYSVGFCVGSAKTRLFSLPDPS